MDSVNDRWWCGNQAAACATGEWTSHGNRHSARGDGIIIASHFFVIDIKAVTRIAQARSCSALPYRTSSCRRVVTRFHLVSFHTRCRTLRQKQNKIILVLFNKVPFRALCYSETPQQHSSHATSIPKALILVRCACGKQGVEVL